MIYAFTIPLMFFQCLTLEPADGETFSRFDILQPASILVDGPKHVKVEYDAFTPSLACFNLDARGGAMITISGDLKIYPGYTFSFIRSH